MVNNIKLRLTALVLFPTLGIGAQIKDPIDLLDKTPPGMQARVFAQGIISTGAIEHSSPAISPDGKTVLWAIMKMPTYQTSLMEINFNGKKWSEAHAPSFADTTVNEVYPNFSADGDTLFFSSDRKTYPSSSTKNTLWYVTRVKGGWSRARALDTILFEKDIYASSVSKNGNRYFTVGPHGTSDWNIYKTDRGGQASRMPPPINARGYEDGPFIAPDETYLIFESDRSSGTEINLDLYISFRGKDGSWTEPLNMGPKVNSPSAERFASVSPDGRYLFFGRNKGSGFDIYWIDAGIIDDLKQQAAGLLK